MARHRLCSADDLPPGSQRSFRCGDLEIAVFNVDGELFAIDDLCTHAEASLADGYVQGKTVICPLHAAQFDLATGEALMPPAFEPVRCYAVNVSEGTIEVDLP